MGGFDGRWDLGKSRAREGAASLRAGPSALWARDRKRIFAPGLAEAGADPRPDGRGLRRVEKVCRGASYGETPKKLHKPDMAACCHLALLDRSFLEQPAAIAGEARFRSQRTSVLHRLHPAQSQTSSRR